MDDRTLLIGLINLVGSLAQKLTGETPLLCLERPDGTVLHIYPATSQVSWQAGLQPPGECPLHSRLEAAKEEASNQLPFADPEGHSSVGALPPRAHDATR